MAALPIPVYVDVGAAANMWRAVDFYKAMLDIPEVWQRDDQCLELSLSEGLSVVICQVRPEESDSSYEKGRTPRLELRVDDVTEQVRRAVAAGAVLHFCKKNPAGVDTYAHALDPFGHLWAFALYAATSELR